MIDLSKIAYQFPIVGPAITAASFLITEDCNLRCKYCFETHNKNKMSPETAKQAVNFLFENAYASRTNQVDITFFGGEPMLAPDIIEIIAYHAWELEKKYNISANLGIITNGTILPESIKRLMRYAILINKPIGVQISIDGPPHVHDTYRVTVDNKGSFHMIEKNFKEYEDIYHDFWGQNVNLHGVLSTETIGNLYESYRYFYDNHPFKKLWFLPVCESSWSDADVETYKNELGKIYNDIMKDYRRTKDIRFIENYAPLDRALMNIDEGTMRHPCGAGKQYAVITASGDLYPCHHMYFNDPEKESFMGNIWDGVDDNARRLFIEYDGTDMTCPSTCDHKFCYRCIAVNLIQNGSILSQVQGNYCKLMKVDKYYQDLIKKEINNMGIIGGDNNKPVTNEEAGFDCIQVVREHGNCHIVDIAGMAHVPKSITASQNIRPVDKVLASPESIDAVIRPLVDKNVVNPVQIALLYNRGLHEVYPNHKLHSDSLKGTSDKYEEYIRILITPDGEETVQSFKYKEPPVPQKKEESHCGGSCGCNGSEKDEFEKVVIDALTTLLKKVDVIETMLKIK